METGRREFLKGAAWMGAAAMAAGCMSGGKKLCDSAGAPMHGFTVAPHRADSGMRSDGDLRRQPRDARQEPEVAQGARLPSGEGMGPQPRQGRLEGALRFGPLRRRVLRDAPRAAPINVYAMDHGKHVLQEVPGAFNLEECWATVEAAERNRRHCMMLENCTYGEEEMLAFNLIKKGKLGEIVQAEVGYTHDQRSLQYNPVDGVFWRIDRHMHHHGNYYPTHGLVPAGHSLDINRGDRFDYLVSMETKSASFETFGQANFPATDWRHSAKMVKGDVNMSLLHTANGKIVTLKHNVCTPSPYDRGNMYLGTKGMCRGIKRGKVDEFRVCFEEKPGDNGAHVLFDQQRTDEIRRAYMHPFWKVAGEISKKVGGHGGMDFIMDLRWAYCLQNGLPLDMDVYDLATYSSIVELSERSVNARSAAMDFPDYTRGGWKTAKPFAVDEIDMAKFDFTSGVVKDVDAQRT